MATGESAAALAGGRSSLVEEVVIDGEGGGIFGRRSSTKEALGAGSIAAFCSMAAFEDDSRSSRGRPVTNDLGIGSWWWFGTLESTAVLMLSG